MQMLNSSKGNKLEAYSLLLDANNLGNKKAKLMVAWALLLGNPLVQNLKASKAEFKHLAFFGDADGHMVCYFIYIYIYFYGCIHMVIFKKILMI